MKRRNSAVNDNCMHSARANSSQEIGSDPIENMLKSMVPPPASMISGWISCFRIDKVWDTKVKACFALR